MAQAVVCPQCGKRYLVPEAYRGRARCPHCIGARTTGAGGPTVKASAATPQAAPRKPAPSAEGAMVTATTRTARRAWEQAAERRRRRRPWPPPRDPRTHALSESLRRRMRGHGLRPYLILLGMLAAGLALFAVLASRHPGPAPEAESAAPRSAWEVVRIV